METPSSGGGGTPATAGTPSFTDVFDVAAYDACRAILDIIRKKPGSEHFVQPVSHVDYPDYPTIVKQPICLNEIEVRYHH